MLNFFMMWMNKMEITLIDGRGYGLCKYPDRKRVCVYKVMSPNKQYPVAWFKKEDDAVEFWNFLKALLEYNGEVRYEDPK